MATLTCFKAYDIRGKLGDELNEDIAYRIGRAYGTFVGSGKQVVVGGDVRLTSETLKVALANGLQDAGVQLQHFLHRQITRVLLTHGRVKRHT